MADDLKCWICENYSQAYIERHSHWVCLNCDKEIDKGLLMIAFCEACGDEMYTYATEPPFRHKGCSKEVVEMELMSVPNAIKTYIRFQQTQDTHFEPAYNMVRYLTGSAKDTNVRGLLSPMAHEAGVSIKVLVQNLARQQHTREAIEQVLSIHLDTCMKAYSNRCLDKEMKKDGGVSCYYDTFLRDLDGTFCPLADDSSSKLPF